MDDKTLESDKRQMETSVGEEIRRHWKLVMAEGVLFMFLGGLAIVLPMVAGLGMEMLLGALFVIGGFFGIVRGAAAKGVPGRGWGLCLSVFFFVMGILLLAEPMLGLMSLTAFLGIVFGVEGVFKICGGTRAGRDRGGLVFFDGALSLLIAVIIWAEWPTSALWVVGLLVGIKLIMAGAVMISLAAGLRKPTAADDQASR